MPLADGGVGIIGDPRPADRQRRPDHRLPPLREGQGQGRICPTSAVQAKLSVVEPTDLMSLVPRISQFANSQNKVNMADFSANDPFHVELEKLSRTVWAPAAEGGTAR